MQSTNKLTRDFFHAPFRGSQRKVMARQFSDLEQRAALRRRRRSMPWGEMGPGLPILSIPRIDSDKRNEVQSACVFLSRSTLNCAVISNSGCRMGGVGLFRLAGDTACDLRNLERVREARTIKVAVTQAEDLGLALQPPERGGMDHTRIIDFAIIARIFTLRRPTFAACRPRMRLHHELSGSRGL